MFSLARTSTPTVFSGPSTLSPAKPVILLTGTRSIHSLSMCSVMYGEIWWHQTRLRCTLGYWFPITPISRTHGIPAWYRSKVVFLYRISRGMRGSGSRTRKSFQQHQTRPQCTATARLYSGASSRPLCPIHTPSRTASSSVSDPFFTFAKIEAASASGTGSVGTFAWYFNAAYFSREKWSRRARTNDSGSSKGPCFSVICA